MPLSTDGQLSGGAQDYPPGPLYDTGRWSNGPTWAGDCPAALCYLVPLARSQTCPEYAQQCMQVEQCSHLQSRPARETILCHHACAAAEYFSDMVGYELHDQAIGSGVVNASISFRPVGDFYPSNLISNKRGTQNVTLPTFDDQITGCCLQIPLPVACTGVVCTASRACVQGMHACMHAAEGGSVCAACVLKRHGAVLAGT